MRLVELAFFSPSNTIAIGRGPAAPSALAALAALEATIGGELGQVDRDVTWAAWSLTVSNSTGGPGRIF